MGLMEVLMLGVVGLMLLGMLALTVWVFRATFQAARGVAQTIGATPAGPLQELGLAVTSDVAGGVGKGQWRGIAVQVSWQMRASHVGPLAPPPEFATTVVAFFTPSLPLGIAVNEEAGAPPCGIARLDGRLRLSAALTPHTHGLLTHCAPHIRHVLDGPGLLQIMDEYIAISFAEIVGDKSRLTDALEQVCALHAALRGHG